MSCDCTDEGKEHFLEFKGKSKLVFVDSIGVVVFVVVVVAIGVVAVVVVVVGVDGIPTWSGNSGYCGKFQITSTVETCATWSLGIIDDAVDSAQKVANEVIDNEAVIVVVVVAVVVVVVVVRLYLRNMDAAHIL